MASGDTYKLTLSATVASNIFQNVWAARWISESAIAEADFTELANDLKDAWRTSQASAIVYTEWHALQLWGSGMSVPTTGCTRDGGTTWAGVLSGTLTGADVTAELLPHQSAIVVTLTTGFAGRRRRGRSYGFGFTENANNSGLVTTGVQATIVTAFNALKAEYFDNGTSAKWELGVWSERTASGCVTNPLTGEHTRVDTPSPSTAFTPITNYKLRDRFRTQRRRVLGVGI